MMNQTEERRISFRSIAGVPVRGVAPLVKRNGRLGCALPHRVYSSRNPFENPDVGHLTNLIWSKLVSPARQCVNAVWHRRTEK